MVFIEQAETPGLGGRITEDAFEQQFKGLNAAPPEQGRQYIYVARERPENRNDPRFGRSVDAITGATQTSMAVERLLNADLEQFRRAMDDWLTTFSLMGV